MNQAPMNAAGTEPTTSRRTSPTLTVLARRWTRAPAGFITKLATRSLEMAVSGSAPKKNTSIGVINAPPPMPVRPTTMPTRSPPRASGRSNVMPGRGSRGDDTFGPPSDEVPERPLEVPRPEQPARPRGREHLHLPRGGRGDGAAVSPLLRRQGLDRHARDRTQGLRPGPDPVPDHARRHGAQLPRGHRLPRSVGQGARAEADRRVGTGGDRARPRPGGAERLAQPDPDAGPAGGGGAEQLRLPVRRGAPRRGEGAGQGARVLVPRRVRAVGSQEPAAGAVEPVQRAGPQGPEHPRLPALELDR